MLLPPRLPKRHRGRGRIVRLLFTGYPESPLRVYTSEGEFIGHIYANQRGSYNAAAGRDPDVPALSVPLVGGVPIETAIDVLQGYNDVTSGLAPFHSYPLPDGPSAG